MCKSCQWLGLSQWLFPDTLLFFPPLMSCLCIILTIANNAGQRCFPRFCCIAVAVHCLVEVGSWSCPDQLSVIAKATLYRAMFPPNPFSVWWAQTTNASVCPFCHAPFLVHLLRIPGRHRLKGGRFIWIMKDAPNSGMSITSKHVIIDNMGTQIIAHR